VNAAAARSFGCSGSSVCRPPIECPSQVHRRRPGGEKQFVGPLKRLVTGIAEHTKGNAIASGSNERRSAYYHAANPFPNIFHCTQFNDFEAKNAPNHLYARKPQRIVKEAMQVPSLLWDQCFPGSRVRKKAGVIGVASDVFSPKLKESPLLFYLEHEDCVDVIRVLHGARDIPEALQS
jgi:hypothetical protein